MNVLTVVVELAVVDIVTLDVSVVVAVMVVVEVRVDEW